MAGLEQLTSRVNPPAANPQEFQASDLKEPTLAEADGWYILFEQQGTTTEAYGAGFGDPREYLARGWSDIDLRDNAAAPGAKIEGKIRFKVYRDSQKGEPVAKSGTYSLNSLRGAVSASRKDKELIPQLGSGNGIAGNDQYLVVECQPAASSVGAVVSAANSDTDQGIAYSEYKN